MHPPHHQMVPALSRLHTAIGPGLLYAGAAIGVSHLVQSTRAGAAYGWWPVVAIVFIHLAKYPFFRIGPQYALLTGQSLVKGYYRTGKWAVGAFLLFTLGTMWAIIAAVVSVTAGIAMYIFGVQAPVELIQVLILVICAALLFIGKYKWLDRSMTYLVLLLTACTALAFAGGAVQYKPSVGSMELVMNSAALIMLIKLMGWMPAPLDLSVWHSIWTLEKQALTDGGYTQRKGMLDFKVGYWGTMGLGVLFLGMGVFALFGSAQSLPDSGVGFSTVLLRMYTDQLGSGAFWVVAIAALATMLSTTLTCLDAIPRSLAEAWDTGTRNSKPYRYALCLVGLIIGAGLLLTLWKPGMVAMVDLATVLSFCSTPTYAWLNLVTMQRAYRDAGTPMTIAALWYCRACILALALLAGTYLVLVF